MTEEIETSQGRFTADIVGPRQGSLVILLHGFPQTRYAWRAQLPALAAAGFRVIAPDLRGYSPGVRPDPRDPSAYVVERCVADVLEIADACGAHGQPFHLAGHNWGGHVAWCAAHAYPRRVLSITIISRPHPAAFARAFLENRGSQAELSRYHSRFQDLKTGPTLLADNARRLRQHLGKRGVPPDAIDQYMSVLGEPEAMEGALAWYRAAGLLLTTAGPIEVPTLYIWGTEDHTVSGAAARATAEYVVGPYRFEALPGIGHYVPDQAPELLTKLLLEHLATVQRS